jgi:hypothetical protein
MSTIDSPLDHRQSRPPAARAGQSRARAVARILPYASARPSGSPARRATIALGAAVGSALVATSGVIHLHLWAMGYRNIPTIGTLFLIQGLTGLLTAVLLVLSRRLFIVVAAAGFMVVTVGGFLLSIYVGLFGFMDTLAAPFAGVSLAVEGAGAAVLTLVGTALAWGHHQSVQHEGQTALSTTTSDRASLSGR